MTNSDMNLMLKMHFLKKIGDCHKELGNHEKAMASFKKELLLSWYTKNHARELESYDCIGIEYYYMGNIDKSIYYHNRMMNRKFEGESREKIWNITKLEKELKEKAYKKGYPTSSFFDLHKMNTDQEFILPHENPKRNVSYFLTLS